MQHSSSPVFSPPPPEISNRMGFGELSQAGDEQISPQYLIPAGNLDLSPL